MTRCQPDGKILIGGYFTSVNGQPRTNIARLHADGTVESNDTFNPGSGANGFVSSVVVQADGKILLAGEFTSVNGQPRNRIARLHTNSVVENTATFNPGTGPNGGVYGVALQADGKILLGGLFTSVNGQTRNRIARLNANGTVESTTTFNPGTGAGGTVVGVAVQADGQILIGGTFTSVNGQPRNRIARLNANGTVEGTTTFNPGTGANSYVNSVAAQADGKILLAGDFTSFNDTNRNRIARLNTDGNLDTTFDPGTGANDDVFSVAVQVDGKILLGGLFTSVNGQTRNRIARLNADGTVESTNTFNAGTGPNSDLYSVAVQADGKILLGGAFTSVDGQPLNWIARLANDVATQTLTITSSARAEWLRGGTAPEVEQVTFELSTNSGGTWNMLGSGTRIAGGWERTGLSLPPNGSIRARGRIAGGYRNSTSGLVEAVTGFLQPRLNIELVGSGVRLSWLTNAQDYTLTSNTNLTSTAWTVVTPAPVIQGGSYVVTNGPLTKATFYRLRKP